MGVYLVAAAMDYPRLTPHQRVALAAYARPALDDDDDPQSFCGWQAVATALGRGPSDLEALGAGAMLTDSDRRAVERVTAELIRAGAMVRTAPAVNGIRARYSLLPLVKYKPRRKTATAAHTTF